MRTAFVAVFVATLAGTPGLAANLAVKAAAPPVDYSWTGFYVGGNFGGGWDSSDWTGSTNLIANGVPGAQTFSFDQDGRGVLGGAQIGFNYQLPSNFVAGVEADIDWSGISGSSDFCSLNTAPPAAAGHFGNCVHLSNKLDDFGTVRGRFGYGFSNLLLYGTGGFAWGQSSTSAFLTCNGEPGFGPFCFAPGIGGVPFTGGTTSGSVDFVGWTVGAGAEWRFLAKWSFRAEYLHLQFNRIGQTFSTSGTFPPPVPATYSGVTNTQTNLGVDIVRVGLNYFFK